MAWLAVSENGKEFIFNECPKRLLSRYTSSEYTFGIIHMGNKDGSKIKCWGIEYNNGHTSYGTKIPKGSIEKLIGKKLTWEDEPYKYE